MLAKEEEGRDITQRSHMLLAISQQSGASGHSWQILFFFFFFFLHIFAFLPLPSLSPCIQTVKIHPLLSGVAVPSLISGTKH